MSEGIQQGGIGGYLVFSELVRICGVVLQAAAFGCFGKFGWLEILGFCIYRVWVGGSGDIPFVFLIE